MPPPSGSLFRVAHARIDRLQDRLPARARRDLAPFLAALSEDVDELLVLTDGARSAPSVATPTLQARIERLSARCAVLEDALGADGMSAAAQRALTAVIEACADIATWVMEAPPSAPAQVA
ncbi:MAG: hypothetical protein M0004_01445 [Actinomycetota bacterium]|nr:hypothetical protein [Actinomycetota bacterium]